jgi:hypothetical protein
MIQGYRLVGQGVVPPKAQGHISQPVQLQSKKFRLMEWGPSCIGYFAADVGFGSLSDIGPSPSYFRFTSESRRRSAWPMDSEFGK